MCWYNLTKAKNWFKKSTDMSGVELSDLKIFKTTSFCLLDCRPDVRPTSTRCMGPVLSTRKALFVCNTDLLFKEDLSTAPSCFLSSFEVQEWWETTSLLQLRVHELLMCPLFIIRHACVTHTLNYAVSFKMWDNYTSGAWNINVRRN